MDCNHWKKSRPAAFDIVAPAPVRLTGHLQSDHSVKAHIKSGGAPIEWGKSCILKAARLWLEFRGLPVSNTRMKAADGGSPGAEYGICPIQFKASFGYHF
jgi:hypothetical protein